jgi:pyruvate dehydrogenase E1 component beta subunit
LTERQITYLDAIREGIAEEMRRDPAIFFIGEGSTTHREYSNVLVPEFGDRIINCPISEPGITGTGLGAALTGMRPIVGIGFVDLMGLVMDQLNNQIAKARYMSGGKLTVPLVVLAPYGATGMSAAQHSQSLEGWFIHIPGIRVIAPATPYDAKGLMKTALREDNPSVYLPHKSLRAVKGPVPTDDYQVALGHADVKRAGRDVTVVSWGRMLHRSLAAADALAKQGVDVEVVDPRTLAPLDMATILRSVEKTVQDGRRRGGDRGAGGRGGVRPAGSADPPRGRAGRADPLLQAARGLRHPASRGYP